jgi:phosphoribosyl-ATP pyrophosphohydrolase/phosphoribosyl-AMP cyclohydrolase
VYTRGGKDPTGLDAVEWARTCARRGAGEILLTSIDRDGVRTGYDLELTRAVAAAVDVPVIASGGAGSPEDVARVLCEAGADAALVAGILHDGITTVSALKEAMAAAAVPTRLAPEAGLLQRLDFAKDGGTVTVVTQDDESGAVLMVARADREAVERTLATGEMHYRSRRRGLWRKGETSGNVQRVVSLTPDCDGDTLLARVLPAGPACHTGEPTCFGEPPAGDPLDELTRVIADRQRNPTPDSYTNRLLADRNLRLKKLGEEAVELALACTEGEPAPIAEEAADLLYHMLVALAAEGVDLDRVRGVLRRRAAPEVTRHGRPQDP